jgi:ADP-ribosylglycohydrolase
MFEDRIVESQLFDKVCGCLAIGAIGDNLGRPVENWHYERIEREYGRLEDPWAGIKGGDTGFDIGTDDTALAQILCHCYLNKKGPILVEDYGEYWLKEMDAGKFFFCLRNTYELLKMGYSPRVTGAFNIVTGSGLMAIHPVGIFNAGNPLRAYTDGVNIASIVQRDLDIFIPGIIAAAVAEAFRPGATCDSVIETAISVAPSKQFVTFDKRHPDNLRDTIMNAVEVVDKCPDVFAARAALYKHCLQYAPIDPQEVLALTFGIFKASGGDTRQAVVGGANIGRDSDTIAGLNGQICGALNGFGSAPHNWRTGLKQCTHWEQFHATAVAMTRLVAEEFEKGRKISETLGTLLIPKPHQEPAGMVSIHALHDINPEKTG